MLGVSRLTIGLVLALPCAGAARGAGDLLAAQDAAIAAEVERGGPAGPALLPLYAQLARLRFRAGDLAAATAAQGKRLTVAVSVFGADSPGSVKAMTALAEAELDQLRYLDAEGLLIVAANAAPDKPQAPILAGLARIALARGDTALAETRAEAAVAARAEHPPARSSAAALRALGAVLAAERRFDEGEDMLKKAIAFDAARHGSDDPETARSLSQLGNLYLRAGRFADALPMLEQAAAIDQARLAPTHPFIADDLHDLGIAYEGLDRSGEARRVLTDAVDILRRGHGANSPRTAFCELELARLDRKAGNAAAADAAFQRAHRILDAAKETERNAERKI